MFFTARFTLVVWWMFGGVSPFEKNLQQKSPWKLMFFFLMTPTPFEIKCTVVIKLNHHLNDSFPKFKKNLNEITTKAPVLSCTSFKRGKVVIF